MWQYFHNEFYSKSKCDNASAAFIQSNGYLHTQTRLCSIRSLRKRKKAQKNIYILLCSFYETDKKGWRKKLRSLLSRFVAIYKRVLYEGEKNKFSPCGNGDPLSLLSLSIEKTKETKSFLPFAAFFVFKEKILFLQMKRIKRSNTTPANKRSSNNINNEECEVNNCQPKTWNPITQPFAVNFHLHYGFMPQVRVYEGKADSVSVTSICAVCGFDQFESADLRLPQYFSHIFPVAQTNQLTMSNQTVFFAAVAWWLSSEAFSHSSSRPFFSCLESTHIFITS